MTVNSARRRATRLGRGAFLGAFVVWTAFPLYWLLTMAFKRPVDTLASPPTLVFRPTLAAFGQAFEAVPLADYLRNSLLVAGGATLVGVGFGLLGAYALASLPFRGQHHFEFWVLSTRMAPPVAVALPFFIMFRWLGLQDSVVGLVIVHVVLVLAIVLWILLETFRGIPRDVGEAAYVDGASHWQSFQHVALPLAVPGIVGAAIISFLLSWNEFFFALILTNSNARTLPVGLFNFIGWQAIELNQLAAASSMILIPAAVVVIFFQRFLVEGLTAGAVKG